MKPTITLFFMLLSISGAFAQYPATNVYVMDMYRVGQDYFKFYNPIFVNSDNKNGYNNQPIFIDNDNLLLTSSRDGKQTDIYQYNFKTIKTSQITKTGDVSEFSPTVIPGSTNTFSSVCIEADGKTQRLWKYKYTAKGTSSRALVLDNIYNVGYHEWLNTNQIALFIVGTPHRLEIANKITGKTTRYASDIGRCMKVLSNGDLVFLQKTAEGNVLKRLDIANMDIVSIAPALGDSEDFAILADDTILMGKADRLYKLNVDRDRQWTEVANLANFKIKQITRIAVSNNKIAIVAE